VIACIRIAHFAATIEARYLMDAADRPLLIAGYTGKRGKIRAVCQRAEEAGVYPGTSVSQALALCPAARTVMYTPSRYQRVLHAVMDTLTHFSQWIEADRRSFQSATIYVDLGKLRPKDGWELACLIINKLQAEHQFTASIGLAVSKFPAYAAAYQAEPGGIRLIPYGKEKSFLAPFPVSLLSLDKETARRLNLYGLRTLGQLTSLPRAALVEQFGKPGRTMHRQASGEDIRHVVKYQPDVTEALTFYFDSPVDNRLILQNVLNRMFAEIALRLQTNNLNCGKMTLLLALENRTCLEAATRLSDRLNAAPDLYRRGVTLLQQFKPASAVISLKVELSRLQPVLPHQLSIFDLLDQPKLHEAVIEAAEEYVDACFYMPRLSNPESLIVEGTFYLEPVVAA
jgi:DNA polymerase IV